MNDVLEILIKSLVFVSVIIAGYCFKTKGFFGEKDMQTISKIIIYVTLPSAIISNLSRATIDSSMLFLALASIILNLLLIGGAFITNRHSTKEDIAFSMLNTSSFNIGNFGLPFAQSFLGATGFAAISLFDAGNAIMCTGFTILFAKAILGISGKFSIKSVLKQLFSTPSFPVYLIMIFIGFIGFSIPTPILNSIDIASNANTFLALFMVGIGFQLVIEKSKKKQLAKIIITRNLICITFALSTYFLLPFSVEIRQALAIASLTPIATVSVAYTGLLKGDIGAASTLNSLSIICSICTMTIALLLML